jgi:hypothetical protein
MGPFDVNEEVKQSMIALDGKHSSTLKPIYVDMLVKAKK